MVVFFSSLGQDYSRHPPRWSGFIVGPRSFDIHVKLHLGQDLGIYRRCWIPVAISQSGARCESLQLLVWTSEALPAWLVVKAFPCGLSEIGDFRRSETFGDFSSGSGAFERFREGGGSLVFRLNKRLTRCARESLRAICRSGLSSV